MTAELRTDVRLVEDRDRPGVSDVGPETQHSNAARWLADQQDHNVVPARKSFNRAWSSRTPGVGVENSVLKS